MKKWLFGALVAGVALSAAPRAASAFSDAAVVKVPFEFIANHTVLPAGTYRITSDANDPMLLYISSLDGRRHVVLPAIGEAPSTVAKVEMEFKQYGDERYLWKIAVPGEETLVLALPPADAARALAKAHADRALGK
jgi:hypothetical protein